MSKFDIHTLDGNWFLGLNFTKEDLISFIDYTDENEEASIQVADIGNNEVKIYMYYKATKVSGMTFRLLRNLQTKIFKYLENKNKGEQ